MKSQNNTKKQYPIDAITFCALMLIFRYATGMFIVYVGNRIGFNDYQSEFSLFVYYAVVAIPLIAWIVGKYKANVRINARKIILPIAVFVINALNVLYTFLLNRNVFSSTGFNITRYLFLYPIIVFVFCNVEDYEKLLHWAVIFARFAWVMPFLTIYLNYSQSGNSFESYDMVSGYELIFCSMILLYSLFKRFNIIDLILCAVTFFAVLGCGSRGSVLAFVIYLGLLIFKKFFINQKPVYKALFVVVVLIGILLLSLSFEGIVLGIKELFNELGINTRTLDSLLYSNTVEESNGNRKLMYEIMVGTWKSMPPTGFGILYDRLIFGGGYCHNIVIEIITDYGFFIGGVAIIWFIYNAVCSLIYEESNKKSFIMLILTYTLTNLMVSGTYLTSICFYILIGAIGVTSGTRKADK